MDWKENDQTPVRGTPQTLAVSMILKLTTGIIDSFSCSCYENHDNDKALPKNFTHCLSSQVKIYSPGYIEQCAAGPSCPVRGGVGCKRCSSSVSCVG